MSVELYNTLGQMSTNNQVWLALDALLRERSPRRRMFCEVLLVITYVVSAIVSDCREY